MNTALILPPTASSFRVVAGMPLIKRTALSALRAGFRVVAVGREYAGQLRTLFDADERTRAVEVVDDAVSGATLDLPQDSPLRRGSGQASRRRQERAAPQGERKRVSNSESNESETVRAEALEARSSHLSTAVADAQITLVPSDCLLTAATLARVSASTLDGRPLLFTAPGEVHIALYRTGMLDGLDLDGLTAAGAEKLWAALRARGAEGVALDGEVCARITDERSVELAEALLCERLRADSADSDGPLAHHIDRRVSLRISRWLVRHTQLRPNHITIIGTSVGLLAAALLSIGMYWSGIAGTLLFLCATIIDGCDGEVARLKFQESSFGQKFDVITDNIVHVAIFIGLAIGLYHQTPDGHYLLLMGILLGGFVCTSVVTYFFLVRRPDFASSGGRPVSVRGKVRQWLLRGFEALMNRDFAYLLVVLAVADRLYWFMWGTAFGTYAFAILLVWIYRWRDAA